MLQTNTTLSFEFIRKYQMEINVYKSIQFIMNEGAHRIKTIRHSTGMWSTYQISISCQAKLY